MPTFTNWNAKLSTNIWKQFLDPMPYLLFTFDDGGVSFLDLIAPALERHGWRGLFFIATNWIGSPGFLKASQIAELRQRGHHIGTAFVLASRAHVSLCF
jgi:peptidoglycan/xylan/chitin deacetylase (PgdA/CDA1 family)